MVTARNLSVYIALGWMAKTDPLKLDLWSFMRR